ncbi:MAG TPA: BtaA family protein [Desulfosalsimonadaceae bacterium]|nr:BtaA family protein [Desulfosalsimonadaceae bacterium]
MKNRLKSFDKFNDWFFQHVHGHHLIYNTCWEDPWVDRQLLNLTPDSRVVMITSAGCNALDYLLDAPAEIHSIDVNPRQNALLELKRTLIQHGSYEDFYRMFGNGVHANYRRIYENLRHHLPRYARDFWCRNIAYFNQKKKFRKSFYHHGTSGLLAWCLRGYLFHIKKKARPYLIDLLSAKNLQEQRIVYKKIETLLWDRFNSWLLQRPAFMSMAGVPGAQIRLIKENYPGGLRCYIKDKLRHVFTEVPMQSNYFWRVYLTGNYSPDCCPNYLKKENFNCLREGIHKIKTYTNTLTHFLETHPGKFTHFILLDHQDWMAGHSPEELMAEWELILKNSQPKTKILFRSAGIDHSFLPPQAKSALQFRPELSEPLHRQDRVGTYGSLHFAEVIR